MGTVLDTQTPAPTTALSLAPYSTHIGQGQTSSKVQLFPEACSWLSVMAFPELKELVLGLWTRHRLRIVLGVHLLLISWATLGRWSHMVKRISNFLLHITLLIQGPRPSAQQGPISSFCISVQIWDLLIRQC